MSNTQIHLEVKLPKGQPPALEKNEGMINKFLKACSKESLLEYLYENSSYTKRFDKPSVQERQRQMEYKRNAQKAAKKLLSDAPAQKPKKKNKKFAKPKQTS